MDAPLSLYLTHFRRDRAPVFSMPDIEPLDAFDGDVPLEPMAAFEDGDAPDEAGIDHEAAIQDALRVAEAAHEERIDALRLSHEAALVEAVDAARAAWVVSESTAVAALIDTAFANLKTDLATGVAAVLRPMLAEAVLGRTLHAVGEALDHLLADPDHPAIVLRGPSDLVAAIRDARVDPGSGSIERIDYVATDGGDVTIETVGTHVETRLAAALAAIQETGA